MSKQSTAKSAEHVEEVREPTIEERAQMAAMMKTTIEAAESRAKVLVEQLKEELLTEAKKAGEAAAKNSVAVVSTQADRVSRLEKGSRIAFNISGLLFFGVTAALSGLGAYKARKAGMTIENAADTGRGRNR